MVDSTKAELLDTLLSGTTSDESLLSFSNIEEAKNLFECGRSLFIKSHSTDLFTDSEGSLAAFEAHTSHCSTLLLKFSTALQRLSESKGPFLTKKEDIAISVLQLHVLSAHVSLYVKQRPPISPSQWDNAMLQMEEIIVLCKKIISSITTPDDTQKAQTTFCLDMGIIIPLYTVASQSLDYLMRRKAIDLLRSTSRQEGLWNSLLVAKAAERIMEIEESLLRGTSASTMSLELASTPSLKPFFELDAKGCRLRYLQRGKVVNQYIQVVEDIFSW